MLLLGKAVKMYLFLFPQQTELFENVTKLKVGTTEITKIMLFISRHFFFKPNIGSNAT